MTNNLKKRSQKSKAERSKAERDAGVAAAAIHYRVTLANLHAHLFGVSLHIARPAAQQVLRLPVWIPGSYLVREFARNLQNLQAHQGKNPVAIRQIDKTSWLLECQPDQELLVRYEVYAFDNSVRSAWLDATRGFFNGTSLFLGVEGQTTQAHTLELVPHKDRADWCVATAAKAVVVDPRGFGCYHAPDYDTLLDCPVEMGTFWSASFSVHGIPHRFVVSGASASFDGARLITDTRAICEAEIRFWHPEIIKNNSAHRTTGKRKSVIPFKNYVFMLNAVDNAYGGLEHRNSTALVCKRQDLPMLAETSNDTPGEEGQTYTTLLGLISHEYFHAWNVKRLRPAELTHYDYSQENYTQLLWFFEGFTSYYDDLLLLRANRIDTPTYLKQLAKTINQLAQIPGRKLQSVAQASFDAWTKFYRPDENTPNATVSYYAKGSLVALCLDLTLRLEGHSTLDAVMRALWTRCEGGPMTENDLHKVLAELGARSYASEITRWVHGTNELPVENLLEQHGIEIKYEPAPIAQRLGLRVKEERGVVITHVLRDSAAEAAGFASGDEWLAVKPHGTTIQDVWRLHTLDDLKLYLGPAKKLTATVARDRRLLQLELSLPKPGQLLSLSVRDAALAEPWLGLRT
ncbi:MAG: M61 family metallopeptidase [Rhodoferax sp.]|nr:M61 family metallopeptidase [Rhodoferax sp.]